MKKYTVKEIKAEFEKLGYDFPVFHLVGIRSEANAKNQFDDLIAVIERDTIVWYTCTTNPGTHWLQNLLNPKGTAVLKPGQYHDAWQVGLHQGKYEALCQRNGNVNVWRDGNKDLVFDEILKDSGLFGINIHKAGQDSTWVENWSEGCQVFKRVKDFDVFMSICKKAAKIHGNKFSYTLLESTDIK